MGARQAGQAMRRVVVLLAVALLAMLPAAGAAAEDAPAEGIGVVDVSRGYWSLQDPASGETTSFYFGNPGDEAFMGDWDCDGVDTPGLYRRSDGYVYLRNSNTRGIADVSFYFGNPGDRPLAGDFDGDGCDSVSIYRPAEARFYIINRLGSGDAGLGRAEVDFPFGDEGDQPLAGDFDGDGVDTIGVFRAGERRVYRLAGSEPGSGTISVDFGSPGDVVLAGAWTGGADRLVAHRRATGAFYFGDGAGGVASSAQYGSSRHRAITGSFGNLPGGDPPPPGAPEYPDVGRGKRIIYGNSDQRIWLVEADGTLAKTHLVSGRYRTPAPGRYQVFSKSLDAWSTYGGITMTHMVRFAQGVRLAIGFHAIPRWPDGTPLQTEAELGSYRSAGCVRQADDDAVFLYNWAPVGTPVYVIP